MSRKCKNRQGLTLLELVVVMVILVALAGILVPMLPGMLGKAHSSAHATNVGELIKAIEMYQITNREYPNGLESLIEDGGDLYAKLPGVNAAQDEACGGDLIPSTLTEAEAESLVEAGVAEVFNMNDTVGANATFDSTLGVAVPVEDQLDVAVLSATAVAELYPNLTGTPKMVVLGVGRQCSAVGRGGMAEPPVHFSDEPDAAGNPNETYARYGLVFNVTADPAEFMGVVAFHSGSVGGVGADGIAGFYGDHHH